MKYHARTIRFLRAQQSKSYSGITVKEKIFHASHHEGMVCDIYEPPKKRSKNAPVIVFLHGMSPLGFKDPRQVSLLSALAYSGFRVVAPSFHEIQSTNITEESIEKLVALIPLVTDYLNVKKIGLFSVSFSGSVCMVAATREEVADKISAICTIGSFSDISSTLEFLFTSNDCDSYARLIILKNYIHLAIGNNAQVKKGIEAAIYDNWHKASEATLPGVLDSISAENASIVSKLLNDDQYRIEKFQIARKGMGPIEKAYSIYDRIHRLKCTVVLFHGHKDDVIHANQSVMLHDHLIKNGIKSYVCISPFLSHGDANLSLLLVKSLFEVIQTFTRYFRAVSNE